AENNLLTSSVPAVTMRSHWDTATAAWLDENGAQVYVDDEGNPTNTGGVPAHRFILREHASKNDTYFSQYNFRSKRNTFNILSNYTLDLKDHQFKFLIGSNIVGYDYSSQTST